VFVTQSTIELENQTLAIHKVSLENLADISGPHIYTSYFDQEDPIFITRKNLIWNC